MRGFQVIFLICISLLLPASAASRNSAPTAIPGEATATDSPADSLLSKPIIDLSGLLFDKKISLTYDMRGDSALSETLPGVRRDFSLKDDSLRLERMEGRDAFISFGPAPLTADGMTSDFDAVARHYQSRLFAGSGSLKVSSGRLPLLILDAGDSIPNVSVRHVCLKASFCHADEWIESDDSAAFSLDSHIIYFYSPQSRYPVAVASTYETLNNSQNVYIVKMDESVTVNGVEKGGKFEPNENGGGTITFQEFKQSEGSILENMASSEEMFHAYQQENVSLYSDKQVNREYEAKLFSRIINEIGTTPKALIELNNLFLDDVIKRQLIDHCINPSDNGFLKTYYQYGEDFIRNYGWPNIKNNYTIPINSPPAVLIHLFRQIYEK